MRRLGDIVSFDLTEQYITRLLKIVQETDISSLRLVTPECELYLSRGEALPREGQAGSPAERGLGAGRTASPVNQTVSASSAAASTLAVPDPGVLAAEVRVPVHAEQDGVHIKCPMIGVYYSAPEPGADPFITLGSRIEAGATVALVEAMKVFSAVSAEVAGTVAQILVHNGDPVEFGQDLLVIDPDRT